MKVNITGNNGCTFSGPAAQLSPNYLLGQSDEWDGGSLANGGRTLEETTDMCMEPYDIDASSGDVIRNLVNLPVPFLESALAIRSRCRSMPRIRTIRACGTRMEISTAQAAQCPRSLGMAGRSRSCPSPAPSPCWRLLCSACLSTPGRDERSVVCKGKQREPRMGKRSRSPGPLLLAERYGDLRPIRRAFSRIAGRAASIISRTSS